MKELIFIAPLPAIAKRTRLAKMASVYTEMGYFLRFFGWEREKGECERMASGSASIRERVIMRGGGYSSRAARAMYPIWMAAVFLRVLALGRGRVFFCLGWETAFPARIAAFLTGATIVFDDADRFSLILKLPGPLNSLLVGLERWTSRNVFMHIVPSYERYEWRGANMMVLRNSPLSKEFSAATSGREKATREGLVVYANGWLGETRGAPVLLALMDAMQDKGANVRMIIAGRVDSAAGEALIRHPLVTYHGEVSQQRALSLYNDCDVVVTYYDPSVAINRKAEANKWGDCVYLDKPFIVNAEVETAREFVAAGAAFAVPYADSDALCELILRMLDDEQMLCGAASRLRAFKTKFPVFDEQLHAIERAVARRCHA